ncbi:hypothetical protein HMPREF0758_3743 [Serratia odorifera DSM 4582]|uniref:Uncharacterized protein n=1 Tax=Serratia odorifera DSM 4582 TaxID=667129 RepID=D4E6E3_SEROD|nr:hypothetical protein HMPREF0758_3743 [Serratia odorifera DSM 4582]
MAEYVFVGNRLILLADIKIRFICITYCNQLLLRANTSNII